MQQGTSTYLLAEQQAGKSLHERQAKCRCKRAAAPYVVVLLCVPPFLPCLVLFCSLWSFYCLIVSELGPVSRRRLLACRHLGIIRVIGEDSRDKAISTSAGLADLC